MQRKTKYFRPAFVLLILVFFIFGCSAQSGKGKNQSEGSNASANPLFKVIVGNKEKGVTTADLKKLPSAQITVEGKVEEGPSLQKVLEASGVSDYKEITITGRGTIKLSKEQVDSETILDFTNRGTVKLASTKVPKQDWVKDIKKIKAE